MNIINTMCTKSLTVSELQDQLLPNKSAEKYSDPTNCKKLLQIYKEKEFKEIITNTTMNKDDANHEQGPPGNPNPTQHVKRFPTPQRIPSPSLVAPQIPQKTHGGVYILKPTSNSRITRRTSVQEPIWRRENLSLCSRTSVRRH